MEPDHDHEYFTDADEWQQPTGEEYPEAFTWNCCNQRGDEDGCIVSRHLPETDCFAIKRAREKW